MRFKSLVVASLLATATHGQVYSINGVYQNNFDSLPVGNLPTDFMVIDGGFAIAEEGGNKFLELPGAPLDTFALLFGPTEKENRTVSARIFGTSKGRRAPTFSVGLGGVGGYKLQVSPGKKALELYKGDTMKTSVPFEWQSGKWTHLVLTVKKTKDAEWSVQGSVWEDGAQQPEMPNLTWKETEDAPSGRASIGGSPYATTPIRYDDLFTGPAK